MTPRASNVYGTSGDEVCGAADSDIAFAHGYVLVVRPVPASRCASPDARTTRRSIAARTAASEPTTRTFAFARVTAV